jgi:hypothetical protein
MTLPISAFVSKLTPAQAHTFITLVNDGHLSVGNSRRIRTPNDIRREALANLDYQLAAQEVVNG